MPRTRRAAQNPPKTTEAKEDITEALRKDLERVEQEEQAAKRPTGIPQRPTVIN